MKTLTWGIYLIVFCLPLYLVRFRILGIPTTVLEILIYVLFIFWLIKEFRFGEFKKLLITHYSLLVAIILILLGVSLAAIFSSDLRASAGIWKAWFVDPILFFIVLIGAIKNFEQVKKVLFSLFLSGTVVSVISLIYLISGKLDPVGRLQAFYTSPNYLAMYLAPALVIGVGYYLFTFLGRPSEAASRTSPSLVPQSGTLCPLRLVTRKKIIPSTFILLSVVCLLASLFFTRSYGAWLGIIAVVCFGFILDSLKSKKIKLAVLFLGLFILASLFLGYFALTQRQTSFDARLIIWQKTWEVFKAHPIFGIGPGTFGNYFSAYPEWGGALSAPKSALSAGVPQPHNIFLAFLLQTGIIGFIGFIWLLIYFFRAGFKLLATHHWLLADILISIMIYIIIHGLVDTTYWKNDLSAVFWLVIGLMAALKKEP